MANSTDKLAKELKKQMIASDERKPKPYDTQAEVLRVEDGVAWVHIPGGVDETPVRLTINAKKGDNVNLHVANGTAWITGNSTNPPTDDSTANYAVNISNEVKKDVTVLNTVVAENIEATNARFTNVEADTAKIHDLTADNLHATVGYIEDLTADNITANDISASSGYIKDLTAGNVAAQDVIADHATVGNLDTTYAKINAANINTATIRNAWVDKIMVQTGLLAYSSQIYTLDAIEVNAANITAGTLDVNRLIVTVGEGSSAQKYLVNIDPSTGTPSYEKLDGNIVEPRTITANKIVANSITTDEITVNNLVGTSGWINLHEGKFFYGNGADFATATNAISWNGSKLQIKADEFLLSTGKTIQDSIESVENWFYSVPPTTSNPPASSWTTTNLKEQHLRDIYFDTTSGKSYRWAKEGSTYKWVEIEDVELAALAGRVSTAETNITNNSEAIVLEAERRESSTSLLLDSDAPNLGKVYAQHNRYFSDAGNTQITGSNFELTDPPENGFKYGRRLVCDGTNTGVCSRAYAFYNVSTNDIPFMPNTTYTATWWARCTEGQGLTYCIYPKFVGTTATQASTAVDLTSAWQKFTHVFTTGPTPNTNYNRIWFYGRFPANTSGTIEICGCKLIAGDAVEQYKTTIEQTADNVLIKATKNDTTNTAAGKTIIESLINVNPDTVKIAAKNVAIDGTATFNAIKSSVESTAKTAVDGIKVGGRNLLTGTAEQKSLTTKSNQNWFAPTIYILSAYANTAIADTNNTKITISFDYSITGVNTAFNMTASLRTSTASGGTYGAGVNVAEIPVGDSSGHAVGTRNITSDMRNNAPGAGIMISGSGNANANAVVTISNVKLEFGNKATDWTPAPEDVQAEIDAKKNTHVLMTGGSGTTYARILGYAKEGTSTKFSIDTASTPITNVKIGDSVRLAYYVTDMGEEGNRPFVYINGTVTAINDATHVTLTGHGIDTTIIDGGNILTSSIGADKIKVNEIEIGAAQITGQLEASQIKVGSISVGDLSDGSNYSTTQQMNTAIGNAVDDVAVGGRNLILNTVRQRTGTSASNSVYVSPNPTLSEYGQSILTNTTDEFTYSFDYEITGNSSTTSQIYFQAKGSAASGSTLKTSGNASGHYSHTFKLSATQAASTTTTMRIRMQNATDGAIITVKNIKLEKGNKETDWSSAPEDYITDIDGTGIRVHTASTENNSVHIDADGVYILKGGTDKTTNSVAFYGDTARIGKDASQHIYIGPGSFSIGKGINNEKQYMNVFIMDGRTPGGTAITGAYYAFTNMGSSVEPPSDSLFGFMLGYYCEATGFCTKAMGEGIVVHYDHQTAIGKYNENDSANAFEIGWGTANTPKNIFAVDVVGNTTIPDDAEYRGGHSKTNFTPTRGSNYAYYGGCYYEKFGPIVHVHVGINGLTANTANQIYTLPIDYRPPSLIVAHGTGGSWNNLGYVDINTSGVVQVRTEGTACCADVIFMV